MSERKTFNVAIVGRDTVGKSRVVTSLLQLQKGAKPEKVEAPEEEARNYTIYNRFFHCEFENHRLNLIDTPGNTNFLAKVNTALYIANGAVQVVSATGISTSSLRIWESIMQHEVPRLVFINMIDVPEANFDSTLSGIEQNFGIQPAVINFPVYDDGKLIGLVDVLQKKLVVQKGIKSEMKEIPDSAKDEFDLYQEALKEQLAEVDDEVMELYIDGEEISEELLYNALQQGTRNRSLTPVLCGVAKDHIGVKCLDDFIEQNFPRHDMGQAWMGAVSDKDPDEYTERLPSVEEPMSAFCFKTLHDRYAGKLSFLLMISGKLAKGDKIVNSSTHQKITVGKISLISGETLIEVDEAVPGDIFILEKMDEILTENTICDPNNTIIYEMPHKLQPRCTFKLELPEDVKEDRAMTSLQKVLSEDPALRMHKNEETNELLLSGMGVMHLQIMQEHLKNVYDVSIILDTPHIAYHETLTAPITMQGKHKKQSGGHGQFGNVFITIEPLPRGGGFEFVSKIVGGVIPKQYIPSVEKGVVDALKKGALGGYPVVDVRVTLFDGSYHDVDSSDFAFQAAGSLAVKKALQEAKCVLLEPVMEVEIDIPEHDMGAISKDVSSRRGRILGYDSKELTSLVTAEIPLAEMGDYAPSLREKTQGLGLYTMSLKGYEVLTSHLSSKVLAERKQEEE